MHGGIWKYGSTGRELAEAKGHAAVVERLRAVVAEQLRAAGPATEPEPARGGGNRLALELVAAVMEGDAAVVAQLLAAGARTDQADSEGCTPLKYPIYTFLRIILQHLYEAVDLRRAVQLKHM